MKIFFRKVDIPTIGKILLYFLGITCIVFFTLKICNIFNRSELFIPLDHFTFYVMCISICCYAMCRYYVGIILFLLLLIGFGLMILIYAYNPPPSYIFIGWLWILSPFGLLLTIFKHNRSKR